MNDQLPIFVFNGWAAESAIWAGTTFRRERIFDYVEQMDGIPEKSLAGVDEFVLVGFSMGSTTALRMLLRFPEKVRGLVLVSATPRMMADDGWPGFSERRLSAFLAGTEMVFADNPSPMYRRDNLERGLDCLRSTDLRQDLEHSFGGRIDATAFPVEVLQSERDGIVRPHNAQYFKAIFPQAEVTMIPGNDHNLPVCASALIDRSVFRVVNAVLRRTGLLDQLVDSVSKGGNFLLNVSPTDRTSNCRSLKSS